MKPPSATGARAAIALEDHAATAAGRSPEATATLEEARECLAYWERREAELPVHAIARRREAREMAARWRDRVAAAEDQLYGAGMLGALLLVAAERRLPAQTRHAGRVAVRTGAKVALVAASVVMLLIVAAVVAAIALVVAIL